MKRKVLRLLVAVAVLAPAVALSFFPVQDEPVAEAQVDPALVVTGTSGHDTHTVLENSGTSICANVALSKAPTSGDVEIWLRGVVSLAGFSRGSMLFNDPTGAGDTHNTGVTFNASNFSTPQQVCVVPRDNDYADGNWDEATMGPRAQQNADGSWTTTPCTQATEWCYGPAILIFPQSSTAAEYDCGLAAATCPSGIVHDADLIYPWYIRIVDDEEDPHYERNEVGTGAECTQADPCTLTEGVATTVELSFGEKPHWAGGGAGILNTMPDGRFPAGHDPGKGISDTNCTQTSSAHTFTLANWATEVGTLTWECADNGTVEHPQPVEIRLETTGLLVPWVTIGCGADDGVVNNTGACQHEPVLYFNKVDPNVSESMTIQSFGGNDTCANQTIPYENTGNIAIQFTVTHGGTVTYTELVAPGASATLNGVYTLAVDGELMARFTSTYDGSVLGTRTKDLDCRDQDDDGYTADIDCDDDDDAKPGAPAGYQLMQNQNGTPQSLLDVCGLQLRGYPASIIRIAPLPECAYWEFDHPSRIMVRVFMLSAGNGNPAQAVVNEKNGSGLHPPDLGVLWIGSQIDLEGNTGPVNNNRWNR